MGRSFPPMEAIVKHKGFWRRWVLAIVLISSTSAFAFDHDYAAFDAILKTHVKWTDSGHASAVDYAALQNKDRSELIRILDEFSAVSSQEFNDWSPGKRMAFLINAYNGFTLKLILSKYPALKSIKDLGTLFSSPWKKNFFSLLGSKRNLDWIEHERLRPLFKDPRVHFAVNCASIGCPALRPEAFTADSLHEQLDDQQKRFLNDRSRNHYDLKSKVLTVSPIFRWFASDFEIGEKELPDWMIARASLIARNKNEASAIRRGDFKMKFGKYDWALNEI